MFDRFAYEQLAIGHNLQEFNSFDRMVIWFVVPATIVFNLVSFYMILREVAGKFKQT